MNITIFVSTMTAWAILCCLVAIIKYRHSGLTTREYINVVIVSGPIMWIGALFITAAELIVYAAIKTYRWITDENDTNLQYTYNKGDYAARHTLEEANDAVLHNEPDGLIVVGVWKQPNNKRKLRFWSNGFSAEQMIKVLYKLSREINKIKEDENNDGD